MLGYSESLAAAARAVLRSPWRPEVKNFGWELVTGCLLVGPRGGAPTDDCAACTSVEHDGDITDSAAHVLTTCAVVTTLRHWATTVINQLAGGDWDHPCTQTVPGFAQFLAYGEGQDCVGIPALMALRGACLHAMRTARAEAHAAHDDDDERRARMEAEDEVDSILGLLPAMPMTHTTDGWTPERVIACAVRELRTAVMCDFHCAKGSYDVNPDHVGYPHARPTSVASFRDMWGSLCFTDGPTLEFTDILHIASR